MGGPTITVFVFSLSFAVGLSCPLSFKDCGSVKGKVNSVGFNGTCTAGSKIALLKKGTTVQLEIGLDSNEKSENVTSEVHGIFGGIPIPFPLGNPDACENCNIVCPVQPGKLLYKPDIEVKTSYPSLSLVVKWELKDDNSKDIICVEIPVKIVS